MAQTEVSLLRALLLSSFVSNNPESKKHGRKSKEKSLNPHQSGQVVESGWAKS
jgi:hypothetical protein